VIAGGDRRHTSADFAHDARTFMTKHAREDAFAVEPVKRVGVCMADARRHDFNEDFTSLRAFQIKLNNLKRLLGFKCDSI
jgi:hypothetical protein